MNASEAKQGAAADFRFAAAPDYVVSTLIIVFELQIEL